MQKTDGRRGGLTGPTKLFGEEGDCVGVTLGESVDVALSRTYSGASKGDIESDMSCRLNQS